MPKQPPKGEKTGPPPPKGRGNRADRKAYFADQEAARKAALAAEDKGEKPPPPPKGKGEKKPDGPPNRQKGQGNFPNRTPPPPREAGSYAGAVAGGIPRFAPGSHPVIFTTSVGKPASQVHFGLVPSTVAKAAVDHLEAIEREPRVVQYTFELENENARTSFRRSYVAAGVLCAAQNVAMAHVKAEFPLGNFSALNSADLPHVKSLRVAQSQYGDFSHAESGMRVTPFGYDGEVRRLIRLAGQILDDGYEPVVLARNWIPSQCRDPSFIWTLASALQRCIGALTGCFPAIDEIAKTLFVVGRRPPWFNTFSRVIPAAERPLWDWLVAAFPATEAEFTALFEGEDGQRRLARLNLEWFEPAVAHLQWQMVANTTVSRVVEGWGKFATFVDRHFTTSARADYAATAIGSVMQMSEVAMPAPGVTVTKMVFGTLPSAMSLAVCFPPPVLWDEVSHPALAVITTAELIPEQRLRWVKSDVK